MEGLTGSFLEAQGVNFSNWKYKGCIWYKTKVQGVCLIFSHVSKWCSIGLVSGLHGFDKECP